MGAGAPGPPQGRPGPAAAQQPGRPLATGAPGPRQQAPQARPGDPPGRSRPVGAGAIGAGPSGSRADEHLAAAPRPRSRPAGTAGRSAPRSVSGRHQLQAAGRPGPTRRPRPLGPGGHGQLATPAVGRPGRPAPGPDRPPAAPVAAAQPWAPGRPFEWSALGPPGLQQPGERRAPPRPGERWGHRGSSPSGGSLPRGPQLERSALAGTPAAGAPHQRQAATPLRGRGPRLRPPDGRNAQPRSVAGARP